MRTAKPVELTLQDRATLSHWARDGGTAPRRALRAKIVLAAAAGKRNDQIAAQLGCARRTVGIWRTRFLNLGLRGLERDAPRSGRKPAVSDGVTSEVLRLTTHEKPPGRPHWSTRSMAQAVGVSHSTVSRIWKQYQLAPHLTSPIPQDGLEQ